MKYLVAKVLIALFIVGNVSALQAHDQGLPNDGLRTQKDCPKGFIRDLKTQQCYGCPAGFIRDQNRDTCVPKF